MKQHIGNILKGAAMGAANVIPGVSGGTIALITGIFERLINAIKSFNIVALQLLLKGKFKEFSKHTDLIFLLSVAIGVGVSIITIAKLFGYLFDHYPIHIWSYFSGLIMASIYFVGRRVDKWNLSSILAITIGTIAAIGISALNPASENSNLIYLIVCGIIAACSMILPGLSGSFVLILMGNYHLIMIDSINELNIEILAPVAIGAGVGLLFFSYILSWVFKKYKNQTIALLTGFIAGSLSILWPWKQTLTTVIDRHGEIIPLKQSLISPWSYTKLTGNESHLAFAAILTIAGILTIWIIEKYAQNRE